MRLLGATNLRGILPPDVAPQPVDDANGRFVKMHFEQVRRESATSKAIVPQPSQERLYSSHLAGDLHWRNGRALLVVPTGPPYDCPLHSCTSCAGHAQVSVGGVPALSTDWQHVTCRFYIGIVLLSSLPSFLPRSSPCCAHHTVLPACVYKCLYRCEKIFEFEA